MKGEDFHCLVREYDTHTDTILGGGVRTGISPGRFLSTSKRTKANFSDTFKKTPGGIRHVAAYLWREQKAEDK